MEKYDGAIKELEKLFNTVAKDNVVYFNDITYTPIPLPVVNAIKLIMEEYPDVGYQIGLYSVKLYDKTKYIKNAMSKKKEEIKSTAIGDIKDQFALGQIKEDEAITQLTKQGKGKRDAKKILEKWKENGVVKSSHRRKPIKSSLGDYFPVSAEEAEDLNELARTFPDKSELRSVLEGYFHIYDDYAQMSVQEFDSYLADYFGSGELERDNELEL